MPGIVKTIVITTVTLGSMVAFGLWWKKKSRGKYNKIYKNAEVDPRLTLFITQEAAKLGQTFKEKGLRVESMSEIYQGAIDALERGSDVFNSLPAQQQKEAVVLLTWKIIDIHDFPLLPDAYVDPILKDISAGCIYSYYACKTEGWSAIENIFQSDINDADAKAKALAKESLAVKVPDDSKTIPNALEGKCRASGEIGLFDLFNAVPALVFAAFVTESKNYSLTPLESRELAKRMIRRFVEVTQVASMGVWGDSLLDKIVSNNASSLVDMCLKSAQAPVLM